MEAVIENTIETAAPAAPAAAIVPATKPLSKKAQGTAIFAEELANRQSGVHATNKAFRQRVIRRMESELGLTTPSAATNYNTAKIEAETAATVAGTDLGLGRDPKVEKPAKEPKAPKAAPATAIVSAAPESTETVLDTTAIIEDGAIEPAQSEAV